MKILVAIIFVLDDCEIEVLGDKIGSYPDVVDYNIAEMFSNKSMFDAIEQEGEMEDRDYEMAEAGEVDDE